MSQRGIEAVGLSHRYPDGTGALADISFRVEHGESVAVVGANGAGKSTLLLAIGGGLVPSGGELTIDDIPVRKSSLASVRRRVGSVFQDADDQLFMPTVREDVAFGPLNMGVAPEEAASRVSESLGRVGAGHLADRAPFRLSGGEKRRVAIATVLAMSPGILVMDEPGTGLDPGGRRQLIDLLCSFEHSKIVATHDLDMVLDICDRALVLHEGRLAADGPVVDVLADAALLERCGLERPARLAPCPACGRTDDGRGVG